MYVLNTLICCVCTALIFLLHFVVYGGMLLQEPGYTGSVVRSGSLALRPTLRQTWSTQWNVRIALCALRLYQLLTASFSVSILFATIEPYHVLCWFAACIVVYVHFLPKLHRR
ncbi:MAG: hypothetical protein V8Q23_08150 [Eubacteriales bacterium]